MTQSNRLRLSSKWTKPSVIITTILFSYVMIMSIHKLSIYPTTPKMIMAGGTVLVICLAILFLIYTYISDTYITKNNMVFKKFFGGEIVYSKEKIKKVRSFDFRKTQYTLVSTKDNKRFLVLTTTPLLKKEVINVEATIKAFMHS